MPVPLRAVGLSHRALWLASGRRAWTLASLTLKDCGILISHGKVLQPSLTSLVRRSEYEEGAPMLIFVVSDGTGMTAEQVVRAALMQFEGVDAQVLRRPDVTTAAQVRGVVEEAAQNQALIVHTLVSGELRLLMLNQARLFHVDAMDLMGPMLDRLSLGLKVQPKQQPGLYARLTAERNRLIEAVEYALRHDDGQQVDELDQAEIVLVGVSRTMKTPVSIYLAYHGWFVANVPLVPGIAPPASLLALPSTKVFGLLMSPERLMDLRRTRARATGLPAGASYASVEEVMEELRSARILCAEHGWRTVSVTAKSVEEIAGEITSLVRR